MTMKKWTIWMMLALLAGCSEDSEQDRWRVTFETQPLAREYVEEQQPAVKTRTWSPPSGYQLYSVLNNEFLLQTNLVDNTIGVFLTQDGGSPLQGMFYKHNDHWKSDMEITSAGDYYVYGFIPQELPSSATIEGNSNYSDGAILRLNGLSTVTPTDVCVVVGAKEGPSNESVTGLETGRFKVYAKAAEKSGSGTEDKNHLYLLFDHLYTALRFNFKVDATYNELRTIKLRKLELKATTTGARAKYNATITLKKNDTGASPIKSVVFEPDLSSAVTSAYITLFDGETTLEAITPSSFMGCFVPGASTYYLLRSTYDVYDRKGNLIRKGCQAENAIDVLERFNTSTVERGHMYSLTLTVKPTYLYVLSDPDLDNPVVEYAP